MYSNKISRNTINNIYVKNLNKMNSQTRCLEFKKFHSTREQEQEDDCLLQLGSNLYNY